MMPELEEFDGWKAPLEGEIEIAKLVSGAAGELFSQDGDDVLSDSRSRLLAIGDLC